MNQVTWAPHSYVDLSDLNAKWDQALPAVAGLGAFGNGSLSGNSLAVRGLGQEPYLPWSDYSADTVAFQEELNSLLGQWFAEGGQDVNVVCPAGLLTVDGQLGPATCGLASLLAEYGWAVIVPATCQSFAEPVCSGQSDTSTTTSTTTTDTEEAVEPITPTRRPMNWMLVGAGVAVVAVGAALLMKSRRS